MFILLYGGPNVFTSFEGSEPEYKISDTDFKVVVGPC